MSVEVAAWNLREGLADADRAQRLAEAICGLDKDVVVLSDAYWLGNPLHDARSEAAQTALERFRTAGYEIAEAEYGDHRLWPGHYMTVLSRLAINRVSTVRLGVRNAVDLKLKDPDTNVDLRIVGAHFSDYSEQRRLVQVEDLLSLVDLEEPTVLAGDLNAMPGNSRRAKLLRSKLLRAAAPWVPGRPPRAEDEPLFESLKTAVRLTDMASGTTLEELDRAGLHDTGSNDTSSRHRSTMPSWLPFLQLDHILASSHLEPSGFRVHNTFSLPRQLSDHRPVSVKLET